MGLIARCAWVLLGLLAVFGAIHAPLHGDEAPCAAAALCTGGLTWLAAVAVAFATVLAASGRSARAAFAAVPGRHLAFLVERGRAPPRV